MSDTTSITLCNRQPFRSGDGCDRGNVDIHQFDDFPFCDSIDPTEASIPPELLDTPLNLPVPPPCACINIRHKFKFNYSEDNSFAASASFAARSDCCGGEYMENFNLRIPCPIDDSSGGGRKKKKIKIKLEYSDSGAEQSGSYMDVDADSCEMQPHNVALRLGIPCPVRSSVNPKIKAKVTYGPEQSKSAEFMEQDKENCTMKGKDATLDLTVPCPVQSNANPKIKAKVEYGEAATASEEFMEQDKNNCTVKGKDVNLNLKLPCPVKTTERNTITAGVGFGTMEPMVQSFLETDLAKCEFRGFNATFNLRVECPVSKKRLKIETSYETASDASGWLKVVSDSSWSDCYRRIKLKAHFPRGGGAGMVLDRVSIDQNSSDRVEIKGWKTRTPYWTNTVGKILCRGGGSSEHTNTVICRRSDGTLGFRRIGFISRTGAICFTPVFQDGRLVRTETDGAWQIGRQVYVNQSLASANDSDGYLAVEFTHGASDASITAQAKVVQAAGITANDSKTVIPVYHFSGGAVDTYFGMPVLPVYDAY